LHNEKLITITSLVYSITDVLATAAAFIELIS